MRFELTTSTLARWRSTTELRPRRKTRGGFLHLRPETGKPKFANFPCILHASRPGLLCQPHMSDKLAEIIATKHLKWKPCCPRAAPLRAAALQRNDFGGFRAALDRGPGRLGVIAEVKKASPSVGLIDPNFDPDPPGQALPRRRCILPLDPHGRKIFPRIARLPVADFEILRRSHSSARISRSTKSQIHEAIVTGADAILLIVAALDDDLLRRLYDEAKSFQLDVLVEVHNLPEMERALELGADLIGVNNRNLKTFAVDLATTERLAEEVPDDVLLVSESGIKTLKMPSACSMRERMPCSSARR